MTAKAAKTFHITKLKSFKNMKKITMICMAAMLLLAASCKKEEQVNENGVGEFSFSVKTETSDSDSKTHLAGTSVVWDNYDVIKVINKDGTALDFTFSKYVMSSDASTAEFNSENVTADFFKPPYTGYYPSDLNPSSYSLPQTQTYSAEGFAAGANPMIATNANNKNLYFKNACGLLRLDLYGAGAPVKIKSITVRSKKSTDKLWGSGNINMESGVFTVTSTESNQNVITLNCNNTQVGTKKNEATSFYIILPAGVLKDGFDITVTDKYDETWSRSTTNNCEIHRSMIRRMPTCCVTEVQLWAGGPYWSTCNIGAETASHYGDYFQWAATSPLYTKENQPSQTGTVQTSISGLTAWSDLEYYYQRCCPYLTGGYGQEGQNAKWSKYTAGYSGVLDDIDDAATQNMGEEWVTPTYDDFDELAEHTDIVGTTNYHGVQGFFFKDKRDPNNYIFLPAAGYCEHATQYFYYKKASNADNPTANPTAIMVYWNSTLSSHYSGYSTPYIVECIENHGGGIMLSWWMRSNGLPIRGIKK